MSPYPCGRWVSILPFKSLNHSRKKKHEHQNRKKKRYLLANRILCISHGLIRYFVWFSLRNVLLLCNRSKQVVSRCAWLDRLGVAVAHVNALNLPSIVLEFFGTRDLCYHAVILSKTLTLRTSKFFSLLLPLPCPLSLLARAYFCPHCYWT